MPGHGRLNFIINRLPEPAPGGRMIEQHGNERTVRRRCGMVDKKIKKRVRDGTYMTIICF